MTEPIPETLPAPTRSRADARPVWTERLARFATAGLRPAAFCAAEGVSLASFYLWKRRLAQPTTDHGVNDQAPRLLPVRLATAPSPLELILPTGIVVRVSPDVDPTQLTALLRLLGVVPC
jgi:transposase